MPDNKKLKGEPDRNKVALGERYEVEYLKKKFGVSSQQVVGAVRAVGNDRKQVEAYLKDKVKK